MQEFLLLSGNEFTVGGYRDAFQSIADGRRKMVF